MTMTMTMTMVAKVIKNKMKKILTTNKLNNQKIQWQKEKKGNIRIWKSRSKNREKIYKICKVKWIKLRLVETKDLDGMNLETRLRICKINLRKAINNRKNRLKRKNPRSR